MKACVFRSNMYILVSGCHTEELSIQRGLKQCDPLAPFFFFLVVEGFDGLMRNAINIDMSKGFSAGE